MKRIAALGIAVLVTVCSFTGCTPELHERLLIRAVGVDSMGISQRVTVRVSDTDKSGREISFTEDGRTVAEALEKISQNTGKKPLYSHNALIIFGRTCAEQGLKSYLDFFLRHYDSRPAVKVLLAEKTAEEILMIGADEQNPPQTEDIAALLKGEVYSGTAVDADLITLINGTLGPNRSAAVPIIRRSDAHELSATGILTDLRLNAELDAAALRGYLVLKEKLTAGETVFEDDKCGTVTVSTDDSRCSIRFTGTEKAPRFAVEAEIEGEISSISGDKVRLPSAVFRELEEQYAAVIAENIEAYLDSAVFGSGCDAAGFGHAVQMEDPAVWQAVSGDFAKFLKNMEVDICVSAQIERVEEEDTPYL